MPVIPVPVFATIEANIASALTSFSAAQAAIDATVAFKTVKHRMRPFPATDLPAVNVSLGSVASVSGGRYQQTVTAHFYVDLHVQGLEGAEPSDEAAMTRLYYLAEQVLQALYALVQADFGLAVGVVARKHWPSFTTVIQRQPETEEQYVFGRWEFDVEYVWEAAEAHVQALTRVVVTEQVAPFAPTGGIDKVFP